MTQRVSMDQLKKTTSDIIGRARYASERSIITKHRKPVAAIVPLEDVALLEAIEDAIDIEEARAAAAEYDKNGGVSLKELMEEIED